MRNRDRERNQGERDTPREIRRVSETQTREQTRDKGNGNRQKNRLLHEDRQRLTKRRNRGGQDDGIASLWRPLTQM